MKKMKKRISMLLAAVMVLSTMQVPMSVSAQETSSQEKASVEIYPTPQSVTTDSEEGMKLSGVVDVIVHGEHDVATLPKVEALLEEEGYTYESKDAVGSNAAIILAVDCGSDDCAICNAVADSAGALTQEQGYVLKSSNDTNENGQITIVGADADGAYYGVMTLLQMYKQQTTDGRIAEVTASDYPDVPFRGYVEGFYGIPWSFNDRKELFEDTTLYKMNTYIYAPKDDPYHRGSWRTMYPDDKAQEIADLVEIAKANNMEFCWTIHPGADYNYSTDSDYNTLIEKFEQVYSLGVRQFGIFYDDLDYGVANGNQHASVINNAYAYLTNKYDDVKPFITVVTRYTNSWGASMSTYFTPFMQQIHEDTIVLWTGQSTMSAVTQDYFEYPQTATGVDRDFGVWWNYPVNDYWNGHLLMSPLNCLDNDVDNICSFFLNPMSEADASKVAIYSGADYSWNIGAFNSEESWSRAIFELVPEANEEFERFADNIGYVNQGSGFVFDESVYLKEEMEDFERALLSGEGLEAEVQNMKARFEQMISDADTLKTINDAELLEEITNHLDAYKALGRAGLVMMQAYEAALEGDIVACLEYIAAIDPALTESTSYTTPILNGTAQAFVGTYRITPFIQNMKDDVMTVLSANLNGSAEAEMLTNVEGLEIQEVAVTDDYVYSVENIEATMNAGDYIGIALPKAMNIYEFSAEATPVDNFKLQYSLNGIEWQDATGEALATDSIVTAAYVRMLCTVDNTAANITEFTVSPDVIIEGTEPGTVTITSNMTAYQSNVIGNAMDGNLSTLFWTSHGSSDGDYLKVDLGAEAVLNSVELYSAINNKGVVDAFAATKLEVSVDGLDWQQIGEAKPVSEFVAAESNRYKLSFDAEGVTARYFRLAAVGESESWLMAYEVLYDAEYTTSEKRQTVETDLALVEASAKENAIDGNMSTWMESAGASQAGNYVSVDLGTLVPLYDAVISFGQDAEFAKVKLQTSGNGKDWTDVGEGISADAYVANGDRYQANFASDGSLVRYICFVEEGASSNPVKVYEIEYNKTLNAIDSASVSTDMGTWESYGISNAMDGNMSSKYYSNNATQVGNYIQVSFDSVIALSDAAIYFNGSPNDEATAIDGFSEMKLQASTDGQTWTDVSESIANTEYQLVDGKYVATFVLEDSVAAKYVRFTATANGDNWVQVYEIDFNRSLDTNAVRYTGGTVNITGSNYLDDGDIGTAPNIYEVSEGDTLIYPMTTITDVGMVSVYQSETVISNAAVSVQKLDGTWVDVGTLDTTWNSYEINDTILAVKFTFNGEVDPVIYEIIVNEKDASDVPEVPEIKNPFEDVYESDYYYAPVMWAVQNGITEGWTDTLYAPEMGCTRGQVVTFLWRAAGQPKVENADNPFTDVASNAYYFDAVLWAVDQGITDGWTDTTFEPEMTCTRGQIVTFLHRAADEPVPGTDVNPFEDVYETDYYYNAILWAVENQITDGWLPGEFAPDMTCTRGQVVTFLHRASE